MQKSSIELKTSEVFTPGGFPTVTYVNRKEKQPETYISSAKSGLSKLIVITGTTKSGKTVLVNKYFPRSEAIWIDGGTIDDENSFWEVVVERADLFTDIEQISQDSHHIEAAAEASLEGNALIVKGQGSIGGRIGGGEISGTSIRRSVSPKTAAIRMLESTKCALIVDDFHYIKKDIQKSIVRALKSPIMLGVPVIFIAIPNRKYDAVEVEREMTGRIINIEMPIWDVDELESIAQNGFHSLNVKVNDTVIHQLAEAAYGSPFLMQEFCQMICQNNDIFERTKETQYISAKLEVEDIFIKIAEHNGRPIFDKLKKGPRARSDRKKRVLKNGVETDVYGVVMESLKELKPGVESIQYDELRNTIKDILADTPPQKNEISRVLDQIAKISASDTSSTPVIDWQRTDDIVTITDPFFAFFLKWSR